MNLSPISNMNYIVVSLIDASGLNEFPDRMEVQMTGVPHKGDTINLHEVIPDPDRKDKGWWFVVDDVEWVAGDGRLFQPTLMLYRKKIQ